MKKILFIILIVCSVIILPITSCLEPAFAQDCTSCEDDRTNCVKVVTQKMEENENLQERIDILATDNQTLEDILAEKANKGDGEYSLADLLSMIPQFRKLDKPTRKIITAIIAAGVLYGMTYIPAPQ